MKERFAHTLSTVVNSSSTSEVVTRVVAIASAPLLPGDKEADYTNLVARVVSDAKPRDAIEELLIRDVIDLTWEILRLRRAKAGIVRISMAEGLRRMLRALGQDGSIEELHAKTLSKKWMMNNSSAREEVELLLKKADLSMDDVVAKTIEHKLDAFERLDRMLASVEARRNNSLREIDRHRAAFGSTARQAVENVEDAEFCDIETGEVSGAGPES